MRNKLTAIMLALAFPLLYLFVREVVRTGTYLAVLWRVRASSPELDGEWAKNQAQLVLRSLSPWLLIVSAAVTLLLIALLFRLAGASWRMPLGRGRLRLPALLALCQAGLGLNLALGALVALLPLPPSWIAEHSEGVSDPLGAAGLAAQAICVVIAAPLVEEVIFRGLAYRYLMRGFSPLTALLLQALLFAAFHGTKLQMLYVFPAALILGFVYRRREVLAAAIALHMAFNACSLLPLPLPSAAWALCLVALAGVVLTALGLRGFLRQQPAAHQ